MHDKQNIVENQGEQLIAEARDVLDQLLKEHKLPFQLRVGSFIDHGENRFEVRFHDSRIFSVEFECEEGHSCMETFRTAVLDRVARMSGPLGQKPSF